jgi:hypothetical protein
MRRLDFGFTANTDSSSGWSYANYRQKRRALKGVLPKIEKPACVDAARVAKIFSTSLRTRDRVCACVSPLYALLTSAAGRDGGSQAGSNTSHYPVSDRDLEAILVERRVTVDHTTLNR